MRLAQLPDDVLYHITALLDFRSLCRLSQVCRSLYRFMSQDSVWKRFAKELLNSGVSWTGTDIYPHIPLKVRLRTAHNWLGGVCKRTVPLKWKTKLLPWLQLDGDSLFLSQAADIKVYSLHKVSKKLQARPSDVYSGHRGDVCRFALMDSHLVSGGSDGRILVHSRTSDASMELSGHTQEVNCLDSKDELIVSGSRDRTVRIWTLTSVPRRETISLCDRVWSVAISPTKSSAHSLTDDRNIKGYEVGSWWLVLPFHTTSFVSGTACCENVSPLHLWDIERLVCVFSLGSEFRRGAGVLDMVFESPFQLLTCGYDTFIRLWDLRLRPRTCVMEWEEPHDSTLYCIQSDGNHMIASGSSHYGVLRLWDKRRSDCLQAFQLSSDHLSSPLYCLRFDSSHLYAALATSLHSLDFRDGAQHCLPRTFHLSSL